VKRRPNIIIIGAMKCATSTLHEQLALQPGIFMSEPKEPNFFSNDEEFARGLDWYESLFSEASEGAICGESSTHYTKLPTYPRTVERLQTYVPDAKFIYVIRHPIDRLISQFIHEWTMRLTDDSIDKAIDSLSILVDYSRYAMQIRPFLETFGHAKVQIVFFESLTKNSQTELERVCRFIGYEGAPKWSFDLPEQNVSSERMRQSPLRDKIVYSPVVTAVRKKLIPQSVRDKVKELWTMKDRPRLSPDSTARLTKIFDEDLAQLGEWLGIELSCENFKAISKMHTPDWVKPPTRSTTS
jgi:hypothetical protein